MNMESYVSLVWLGPRVVPLFCRPPCTSYTIGYNAHMYIL